MRILTSLLFLLVTLQTLALEKVATCEIKINTEASTKILFNYDVHDITMLQEFEDVSNNLLVSEEILEIGDL